MTKYVAPKHIELELAFEEISDLKMLRDSFYRVTIPVPQPTMVPYDNPKFCVPKRVNLTLDEQRQLEIVERILKSIK